MKESSPRFLVPASSPRPRGSRLLTAFSPKLGRTVVFFDHACFDQWIRLEADPGVLAFCERPRRVGSGVDGPLIDFWVGGRTQEEMLIVETGQLLEALPPKVQDVPLRLVPTAEQAAAAIWVSNWHRLIPVINATRGLAPKAMVKSVLSLVCRPLALAVIESELSFGDPAVVRGAVFELLRTGQLMAPSLHTQPLSMHTMVEPAI